MGSVAATDSIDGVLEAHEADIKRDYEALVPESIRHLFERVELENNLYGIIVTWVFRDGSSLPGPEIQLEVLADHYPDCIVRY